MGMGQCQGAVSLGHSKRAADALVFSQAHSEEEVGTEAGSDTSRNLFKPRSMSSGLARKPQLDLLGSFFHKTCPPPSVLHFFIFQMGVITPTLPHWPETEENSLEASYNMHNQKDHLMWYKGSGSSSESFSLSYTFQIQT